jgi:DNA gyrase subunit B
MTISPLDSIRRRPGMYIGDTTDGSGLTHLVWELVSNSLDQHLARRCTRVDVLIERDGSVVVDDDGPGIRLDELAGRAFAEVALTQFHATPTFDGHAPHEHVGRRGVGLFVLNALSSFLILDVFSGGFHHTQRFEKGCAVSRLEKVGPTTRTGTRITLQPDPMIFSDTCFNTETITVRLRELACLLPTLTLTFQDRREHVFHEPRGLCVLLQRRRGGLCPVGGTLLVDRLVGAIRVEAAVEWLPEKRSVVESYANVVQTTDGGTHARGLIEGLADALREAVPVWKTQTDKMRTEVVSRGLHAVVCVRLNDATFGSPTKNRLMNSEAQSAVSSAIHDEFVVFVRDNPALREHFACDV